MIEYERARSQYEKRDAAGGQTEFWSLSNPVVVHLMQERERAVLRGLTRMGIQLSQAYVLDVGCGNGNEFASLLRWGAKKEHLHGVELSPHRAKAAAQLGLAEVVLVDGEKLPYKNYSFDIVVQNVVFSSIIDDSVRKSLAEEMFRVLKPGGFLVWYDSTNSRSRDVHFKDVPQNIVEHLFPQMTWNWQKLTTHLGLLRRINYFFGESGMRAFDLLNIFKTHKIGFGRKID